MRFPIYGASGLAVLAFALTFIFTNAAISDDGEKALADVRAKVSAQFEAVDPENVHASPIDGWFTIQQGSVVAYISADGRYLLQGDLIDLEEQVNLSERSRNDSRRDLMQTLGQDDTISFSPADAKYSVTVFTDIDCAYCRKLHSEIDEYMSQGIEVRYLLYPRNGPASKAWSTSEKVWCSKDRNEALTLAKLDKAFETSDCETSAVTKHYGLGRDVGLNGTPAIVLQDGTLIAGYVPPAQLSLRLQQNAAK